MNFEVDDHESVQALDHNQQATQREFGVDNGCEVTINTGNLGTGNNALTVAAGDVMFTGSSVSVASQSVDIDLGDANPRKDLVYIDSTGSAVVSKGTPEKPYPSNTALGPFEYQRPAPNDLLGTDAVVICSVWVGESSTTVSASELRDRRVSSRGSFTSIKTDEVSVESEGTTTVTDDGVWSWYMDPRAMDGGGKTFVGWVNSNGDVEIGSYDHNTEAVQTNTLKTALEANDHAAPGLAIDGNGIVYAFYSDQDTTSTIYWKKSTSAHDITSMSAENTISTSSGLEYCNPRVVGGRIYIFYQLDNQHWQYQYSDDDGSTWSAETEWLTYTNGGAYVKMDQPDANDRIDFAVAITTGNDPPLQDVYHGYFQGGTIYTSGGVSLGSTTDLTNLTQIYDTQATGNHAATVFDCAKVDGTPQVVFGTYPDKYNDHVYRYATYKNGSWTHRKLVNGGSTIAKMFRGQWSYSGLASIDRTQYGTVFASIGDSESGKVVRMETQDDGQTWYGQDYSTAGAQNVRPVCPHDPSGDVPALWLRGRYNHFSAVYDTSVVFGRETSNGADNAGGPGGWNVTTLTSNQTVEGPTERVLFDEVREDARDEFDTANNQFVAEEYGLYSVDCSVTIDAGGTTISDVQAIALLDMGGFRKDSDYQELVAGQKRTLKVSATYYLNPGDTAFVEVNHGASVNLPISSTWNETNLKVTQIR